MLVSVADALRARLRPYDTVARIGGDEFVCAVIDLTMAEVTKRFHLVREDLKALGVDITVGLTPLEASDTVPSVISRADEAMYAQRRK